jgi:hypothetical protein
MLDRANVILSETGTVGAGCVSIAERIVANSNYLKKGRASVTTIGLNYE